MKSKATKGTKLKKVEIEWVDATAHAGWVDRGELWGKPLMRIATIGYLAAENKYELRLVRDRCLTPGQDQLGDLFIVPKSWVKKIRIL